MAIPKLLTLLNSASETPYLIWNASLRAELLEFVTVHLEASYAQPASAPLDEAERLEYDGLRKELKVGSVYVRVYCEHPTFPLHDAPQFCTALLDYLSSASPLAARTTANAAPTEAAADVADGDAPAAPPPAAAPAAPPPAAAPSARFVSLGLRAMLSLLTSTHNFNLEDQLLGPGRLPTLLSFVTEEQVRDLPISPISPAPQSSLTSHALLCDGGAGRRGPRACNRGGLRML